MSEFCAIKVSSTFIVDIFSGILKITSLDFLIFLVFASKPHTDFVFISFSRFSISSLLLVPIRTEPF